MKASIVLLCGYLLLACSTVQAQERLTLKPQTCVVDESGVCQTVLKLEYRTERHEPVCFSIEPLRQTQCRAKAKAIQRAEFALSTEQDVEVKVTSHHDGRLLAQASMKVATFEPRVTRKRRHFSWSF